MNTNAGNEARLAAWLAQHGAIVRRLSRVYATDAADRQDLHQEMLIQLWRSLPSFREQARESTWIYRVCLNTALTWKRAWQRRQALAAPGACARAEAGAVRTSPAEIHEHSQQVEVLMSAMRELPAGECSLLVLALEGVSHREIGEVLGMTENHVGVALLRARRKLNALLQETNDEL